MRSLEAIQQAALTQAAAQLQALAPADLLALFGPGIGQQSLPHHLRNGPRLGPTRQPGGRPLLGQRRRQRTLPLRSRLPERQHRTGLWPFHRRRNNVARAFARTR